VPEEQDAALRVEELSRRLEELEVGRGGVSTTDKQLAEMEVRLEAKVHQMSQTVKDLESRIEKLEHVMVQLHSATGPFRSG
jgi:predicted nuclease with TOPRIM domain